MAFNNWFPQNNLFLWDFLNSSMSVSGFFLSLYSLLFFVFHSAEPSSTVAVSYSCFCQQAFITSDIVKSIHVPGAKDNRIKQSSTLCCDSGKQFEIQWPKGGRIRWWPWLCSLTASDFLLYLWVSCDKVDYICAMSILIIVDKYIFLFTYQPSISGISLGDSWCYLLYNK